MLYLGANRNEMHRRLIRDLSCYMSEGEINSNYLIRYGELYISHLDELFFNKQDTNKETIDDLRSFGFDIRENDGFWIMIWDSNKAKKYWDVRDRPCKSTDIWRDEISISNFNK